MSEPLKLTIVQRDNTLILETLDGSPVAGILRLEYDSVDPNSPVEVTATMFIYGLDGKIMRGRRRADK